MGKHEKFEHPHVKGETDPYKIKQEHERIQRAEREAQERLARERQQRGKR